MLEYTIDEAIQLLSDKQRATKERLEHTDEDLLFLRDQITVTEVNTARIYNWDVKMRRQQQQSEQTTHA
jgi:hypothetical protein